MKTCAEGANSGGKGAPGLPILGSMKTSTLSTNAQFVMFLTVSLDLRAFRATPESVFVTL